MSNSEKDNKSKKLIVGTLIYAIGAFGPRIFSFLLVPIYTFYISPSDMGEYDFVLSTINLLTPLITLQISDGAYALMMRYRDRSKDYITAVYKFITLSTMIGVAVLFVVNEFIPIPYFIYFVCLLVVGRWLQSIQKLLRGSNNQKLFAASGIINSTVFILLNVVLITVFKLGVHSIFISTIIANIVSIISIFALEKKLRCFDFRKETAQTQKEMLAFSIPLIPNRLNWWAISSFDRIVIRFFLGSYYNGIYAVAYKFPALLQTIYNVFYESWQDTTVGDDQKTNGEFYTRVFRVYYKLSFTVLLALIPVTNLFIKLFLSEAYVASVTYVPVLYLGTVFQAFSQFFGVGYLKNDNTKKAGLTSVYAVVINSILNITLIKLVGLHAASISTLIAFLVMFIMRVFHTRQVLQINVNWIQFLMYFSGALFVTVISTLSSLLFVDLCLLTIGTILLFTLNISEIRLIVSYVLNRFSHKQK